MAKNIDRMKKALGDKKEEAPTREPQTQEEKKSLASNMIKGMKKKEPKQNEYSQFRMRTEILDKMKAIAERENAVWPGQLIHTVLSNFIAEYESENSITL